MVYSVITKFGQMKNISLLFLIGFFVFVSCKNDPKVPGNNNEQQKEVKKIENTETRTNDDGTELAPLYNPCSLVSIDELSKVLDISPSNIKIKPSGGSGSYSKSCFISWENIDNGSKNSMFLMLQTDPIPGDFEDWAKSFIEAKINTGDMGYPNTGMPYKYEKVEGLGNISAYNDELKRFFYRYNKDYVIAIFYNAGMTKKNRIEKSKKIIELLKNGLKNKVK